MRALTLVILAMMTCSLMHAQTVLRGKVMDSRSDVPLDGATIFNTTQGIFRKAGQDGLFSIRAGENDVIIFSSTGYRADTVAISSDILATGLYLGLQAAPLSLDTVTITQRTYSDDSLQRRMEYAHFLERRVQDITGGNDAQYGFGVTVSPITYFSKSEKEKRRFKKRFVRYERDSYIDYRFSAPYVHRVTGLEGEALQRFLREYRPSYAFLRSAKDEDLLLYINDSFKKFKNKK